ncbi:adhesin/hemagglutinin [Yersinia rohdei]|uniref:colicin E3/pyocin S6 family cytotoxin n=1 Tax=Yersinia rohdei TaxID=29485 RepID=UPI0005DC1C1D|nr:colicin E3/pyocin S6 family cytotoxin [Yersinia rohdei]CNI82267.1 adhesin/hemagglutinin [Yersinia rohdei]
MKQAAESLKNQIRDKLGEGTTSSIANAIITALADTGDTALGGGDYALDYVMALEATGGMIASILLPGKKIPHVVKAVDLNIKIATGTTVGYFEKNLAFLSPRERVAMVEETAPQVAAANGMVKDNKLTKLNNRDVYRGLDGNLYALDTQHGRFEAVTSKGKHLGEVDFYMQKIPNTIDKSGGHDLKVK